MRRQSLQIVLVAALVLALSTAVAAKTKIVYWEKWTGEEAVPILKVVEEFNRRQDAIEVEYVPVSDLAQKTITAIVSGEVPDVVGGWIWEMHSLAANDQLIPLDSYAAAAGIGPDDFLPGFWESGTSKGKLYGLFTTGHSWIMYYNKTAFAESGLDPEAPPVTIDELDMVAKKVTRIASNGDLERIGFHFREDGMSWSNWRWPAWFNAKFWDEENQELVNDPNLLKFYRWVEDWARQYGVDKLQKFESTFGGWGTPKVPFFTGKTVMTFMGPWMDMHIQMYAPDLDAGVAAWPAVAERAANGPTVFVDADLIYIPKGSKHPDEAFEFIKFLNSPEGQELLNNGTYPAAHGRVPVRKDYGGEAFIAGSPNRYIRQHIDLMNTPNVVLVPEIPIFQQLQRELGRVYEQAMVLDGDAEANLQRAFQQLQRELTRYKRSQGR
ncbi:MAG: ABC transporter substrate-binding protein [Firmicutes bacterium]|nr:ABC transporter substrate-binding protein [Bacillota bacterium]